MPALAALALGAALLVFDPRIRAGYTIPKLAVLAMGLVLAGMGSGRRRRGMDWALALVWGSLALSTLASIDPWASVVGRYNDFSHGLWAMALATGFLLLGTRVRTDTPLLLLSGFGVLVGAWTFAQRMAGVDLRTGGRALGPLGDPIATGLVLACLAPLCLRFRFRWLTLAVVAAGIWATGNRGSAGAALAGVVTFLWLVRR